MWRACNAEQPVTEEQLLTGRPEPTNEWYAIAAKIAGIKLCQARQSCTALVPGLRTDHLGKCPAVHVVERPQRGSETARKS